MLERSSPTWMTPKSWPENNRPLAGHFARERIPPALDPPPKHANGLWSGRHHNLIVPSQLPLKRNCLSTINADTTPLCPSIVATCLKSCQCTSQKPLRRNKNHMLEVNTNSSINTSFPINTWLAFKSQVSIAANYVWDSPFEWFIRNVQISNQLDICSQSHPFTSR